ncbi:hypothetical protein [Bradyrhizobium tunisiense]|uniref:hypothetical protein n=1 Tax=Bradyrhizobium tunisiense TaxID=3278709 RepID=UPI0035E0B2CF
MSWVVAVAALPAACSTRSRRRRQVDQDLVAALGAARTEHLALDRVVAVVLPHHDELGALKAAYAGLALIAGCGRVDQDLVHGVSLPQSKRDEKRGVDRKLGL